MTTIKEFTYNVEVIFSNREMLFSATLVNKLWMENWFSMWTKHTLEINSPDYLSESRIKEIKAEMLKSYNEYQEAWWLMPKEDMIVSVGEFYLIPKQ